LFQHVKVGSSCHIGFSEEEGPIDLSVRNGTEDIEFGGNTFVFQDCMRIFTPCDFFLQGYIKNRVFVPPLVNTLVDLCVRITAAITEIDPNMLLRVWEELNYRLDVCRVMRGAHIEHL
jgi:hypothetical protein